MMDIAKSETFKNFIIFNKALLFLIKLSKTAVQLVYKSSLWKYAASTHTCVPNMSGACLCLILS